MVSGCSHICIFKNRNGQRNSNEEWLKLQADDLLLKAHTQDSAIACDGKELKNSKEVNLSNYSIVCLPKFISNFTCLESLRLDNNSIFEFPAILIRVPTLKCLDISSNNISILPFDIGHLINLECFMCNSNQLKDIPTSIGRMRNLKVLELSKNNISTLPSNLGFLRLLQSLDVSYNYLNQFPDRLPLSKDLKVVSASNNFLTEIPTSLRECHNLELCNFKCNELIEVPEWLFLLPKLQELYLDENKIKKDISINESISCALRVLTIKKNFLTELGSHSCFEKLPNLMNLEMGNIGSSCFVHNMSEVLPSSMVSLRFLTRFECSGVGLQSLPEDICNLHHLEWLDFGSNKLHQLPDSFCNLNKLKYLVLYDNELTRLPAKIGDLVALQFFNIKYNKLSELPDSFSLLKNLSTCDLSYNEIWEFPNVLENLNHLIYLDVYQNKFTVCLENIPCFLKSALLNSVGSKIKTQTDEKFSDENWSDDDCIEETSCIISDLSFDDSESSCCKTIDQSDHRVDNEETVSQGSPVKSIYKSCDFTWDDPESEHEPSHQVDNEQTVFQGSPIKSVNKSNDFNWDEPEFENKASKSTIPLHVNESSSQIYENTEIEKVDECLHFDGDDVHDPSEQFADCIDLDLAPENQLVMANPEVDPKFYYKPSDAHATPVKKSCKAIFSSRKSDIVQGQFSDVFTSQIKFKASLNKWDGMLLD